MMEQNYEVCDAFECSKLIKAGDEYYSNTIINLCLCAKCGNKIFKSFTILDEHGKVLSPKKKNRESRRSKMD